MPAAAPAGTLAPHAGRLGRLSPWLYLRPRVLLLLLLVPPLLWLGIVYLGSLLALLAQSFFYVDDFTGLVVYEPTLATFAELFTPTNLTIILRTVAMAAAVTLISGAIAFPLAYYMARFSTARSKAIFYLAVMLPLWSNYLVRVYAWKLILAKEGVVTWLFDRLALGWLLDAILALPVIGGASLAVFSICNFLLLLYILLALTNLSVETGAAVA